MDFFKRKPKAVFLGTQSLKPLRWILPNRLAVGPIPDETIAIHLAQSGVKAILTLCDETEGQLPAHISNRFQWKRYVLPDGHYKVKMKSFELHEALECLHLTLSQNLPTYVHCLAGMERSPTVCVSYLCIHEKMPLWEALNWVKQCNPRTSITNEQLQVIQQVIQQQT